MVIKTIRLLGCLALLLAASGFVRSQADPILEAISNLSNPDREVRYTAAHTLCKSNDDPRTNEPLLNALNEPDDEIRMMVVRTMGFRKEKRAVSALIAMLSTATQDSRGWIAEALGMIGDPAAVEPLIAALAKEKRGTKWMTIQALGMLNDPRSVRPLFDLEAEYGDTLPQAIGSAGVEEMVDILKHGSAEERDKASWILQYIADERALDALILALEDKETNVAWNAINAISGRVRGSAINPLVKAFSTKDVDTKRNIIRTLARIQDDAVAGVLVEVLSESDMQLRVEIVKTLAEFLPQSTMRRAVWPAEEVPIFILPEPVNLDAIVPAMLAAARDKEPSVRNLAVRSLAGTVRDDVYHMLLAALQDASTKIEAALALGVRGDITGLPVLLEAIKSNDPEISGRSQFVLVRIGAPAVNGLIGVLNDKNKEFRLREIRRIQARKNGGFQFRCGNEPPPPILDPRALAARALGIIGDERARPALSNVLKDKDEWLRAAGLQALADLDAKARAAKISQ